MQQVIVGGSSNALGGAATLYAPLMGGMNWAGTQNNRYQCIPTGGTISSLYVELSAAVGEGDNIVFTVMYDGAPSTLTCTLTAGQTTGSDVAHSVAVVAGKTVSIRSVSSDTTNVPTVMYSTFFTSTVAGESICMTNTQTSTSADRLVDLEGATYNVTDVTYVQAPMPTAGTFKQLYVVLSADPGTDPDAYTIALQVAGVSVNNTVTIVANNTSGNSAAATDAVNAGDLVNFIVSPVSTPGTQVYVAIGIVFVSGTDGESIIIGGATGVTSNSATRYHNMCGAGFFTWNATEATMYSLTQVCTIRNLYVKLTAAPYANSHTDDWYDVSIEKDNSQASGLTVRVADLATTGSDLVNTWTFAAGDTCGIKTVPNSAPTSTRVHIGLVGYINPATGWAYKIYGVAPTKVYGVAPTKVYGV